jgi:hypothetical protein
MVLRGFRWRAGAVPRGRDAASRGGGHFLADGPASQNVALGPPRPP